MKSDLFNSTFEMELRIATLLCVGDKASYGTIDVSFGPVRATYLFCSRQIRSLKKIRNIIICG